jgi:hypothetical protein
MMLGLNWLVQRTWLRRSIRAGRGREMAAVMGSMCGASLR